jgi:hypothetical protein
MGKAGVEPEVRYNVHCVDCGQVFQPLAKSPLWWQAKQRAEKGYLDALHISGEKCGCEKTRVKPNALFRVFGYNDMCEDFDIPCRTFVEAVRKFISINKEGMNTVFIDGVSNTVQQKLMFI